MKAAALIAGCALALAVAPGAAGSVRCAPPGVAGVTQYYETLPGVSCSVPSPVHGHHGSRGSGSTGSGGSGSIGSSTPGAAGSGPSGTAGSGQSAAPAPLPSVTRRQLNGQGPTGRAVEKLVASGGAPPLAGGGHGSAAISLPPATGKGVLAALLHPLVSGSAEGGIGAGLPLFLAAVALVVLGALVLRRRRRAG